LTSPRRASNFARVPSAASIGIVLIGRNEGERLVRSLDSVCDGARPVVYVDSGSEDDSCNAARERGAQVVDLDTSIAFSAARARNEGWKALLAAHPDLDFVQFIDGDCEVFDGWLEAATAALQENPDVVAVCGWRRERYPEATVFNRMCDVEWRSGSVGSIDWFGGDVMIRAESLRSVGGYDPSVIAGEDPELSVRLRKLTGGTLLRIDRDMTLHDAAMHHFSQWWNRAKRAGHAYAQVNAMHGDPPERFWERDLRRAFVWGFAAPASAVVFALPTVGLSCGLLARYPVTAARTAKKTRDQGFPWGHSIAWGLSCAAAPFPEFVGIAKYRIDQLRNRAPEIIEYKGATPSGEPRRG